MGPLDPAGKQIDNHKIFLLKILVFLLVVAKGFDRLIYAAIWAEDGKVFLKQAFEIGWVSLFYPYDGYFHTLPRLIALAGSWLPISWIPAFMVIACYLVFTYTITLVLNRSYRWLFGSASTAFLCSLVLLVAPGQATLLGNATNLHWYLLLLLAILSLKDMTEGYSIGEIAIAFICIASEGAVILLLPVFAVRIWLKKRQRLAAEAGEWWICSLIMIFTIVNIVLSHKESAPQSFDNLVELFLSFFSGFFLLHIFVGDFLAIELQQHPVWLAILATSVFLPVLWALIVKWEQRYLLVLTLSCCALLLPVMIAMVRPQNVIVLQEFIDYDTVVWFRFRYSFFVPAIATIFWFFCIGRLVAKPWAAQLLVAVILLSQIGINHYRIPVDRYDNQSGWSRQAQLLQQSIRTGCPREVLVPINPEGWEVLFRTGETDDCQLPGK